MISRYSKIIALVSIAVAVSSCSGKTAYYDTSDALTRYPEVEMVTFKISGSASCKVCKNVTALQIEIIPEDDPMTTLAMNIFDNLGAFYFSDIRYKKGAKITLYGKVYIGTGDVDYEASTDVTVPDDDGETVSCVINF